MKLTKQDTLRVPGASLYYEVRGSGPLLLMIAGGGGGGAGDWNGFVNALTDAYTVVTYDRRGALRSTLDAPVEEIPLETHGDDAHRLLEALSSEPAYVFGSSAGALVGLDLVARHPEQVRTLVAHEPPAHYLVTDEEPSQQSPLEIYRREGGLAALRQYAAQSGIDYQDREAGVVLPEVSREGAANADALFKYTFLAVRRYRLDFAALSTASTRIVLAGGSAGRESVPYRCTVAVAERLGTTVVEFPSHHAGYITHPQAFAQRLREVLSE
ncbi:MAG: alpha/beta hydrolase [Ktedonobacteraceae bacterium]|nr:alpha/beta hydrolase [Ktedonobacteraceae bacterium]